MKNSRLYATRPRFDKEFTIPGDQMHPSENTRTRIFNGIVCASNYQRWKATEMVSATGDAFPGNWEEMVVGGKFFARDKGKVGRGAARKMATKGEVDWKFN